MILTIIIIAVVVAADLVTKRLAETLLSGNAPVTVIPGVVEFNYQRNSGAAFGMLSDNRWVFLVFSVISIALIFAFLFIKRPESRLVRVSLAMIAGGGIGNMIERVTRGDVTDFINPTFVNFAVFNVADSCVTVGCFILILRVILDSVREARAKKALASGANSAEPDTDAKSDAEPGAEAKADAEPDADGGQDAENDGQ